LFCEFGDEEVKHFDNVGLFGQKLKNSVPEVSKIVQQETVEMLFKLRVVAFVSNQHLNEVFLHNLIRRKPKNSQNHPFLLFICDILVILEDINHFVNEPGHFGMVAGIKFAQCLQRF
jgi:hypothetical protein